MTALSTDATVSSSEASFANYSMPEGVDCPATRPRSARFVAHVDLFSQSPANERSDEYWLSTNRTRSHWFLWLSYYDDELGEGWVHQVYAYMPRRHRDARRAAMELLLCGWRAERDLGHLSSRPEGTVKEGLLKSSDIDAIARSVWPK
jgi:hypothetical protein